MAGDADAQGGAPVVYASGSTPFIAPASGTEAAAPLWAGLMALADQYAHHDLGFVNPAIYRIARSSRYHKAFHDITTGNSKLTMPYPAGTPVTRPLPGGTRRRAGEAPTRRYSSLSGRLTGRVATSVKERNEFRPGTIGTRHG